MQFYCGLKQQPPGYRFETAEYETFQAIYITSGELVLTVQNVAMPLHAGSVCVLPVGSAFRLHCAAVGYQGVFVIITGEGYEELAGEAKAFFCPPEIRAVVELIEGEVRSPGQRTDQMMWHFGMAFAELCYRRLQADAQPEDATAESWVRHACRRIEKTIYTGQPLEQCLEGVALSYRQLSRHFQAIIGMTPKQYQLQCRIEEARRLLADTRLSITAIALELGFASSQHFSTQFAQLVGERPSDYRRNGG